MISSLILKAATSGSLNDLNVEFLAHLAEQSISYATPEELMFRQKVFLEKD